MAFSFAGYPEYLERSALALSIPDRRSLDEARRQHSLTRLSNLIAGTMSCPKGAELGVLEEARRSRDALAIAFHASEKILEAAHRAFQLPPLVPIFPLPKTINSPLGNHPGSANQNQQRPRKAD